MKIAVLSDTHGNYSLAIKMLDRIADLDFIIHLGDTLHDADIIEQACSIPVIKLAGNCDSTPKAKRELLLNLSGRSLFLSHGDLYRVKNGTDIIYERASSVSADIVLYGHTHIPTVQKKGEVLLVNPGTLKEAVLPQSLAIVQLNQVEASAEIIMVKDVDLSKNLFA